MNFRWENTIINLLECILTKFLTVTTNKMVWNDLHENTTQFPFSFKTWKYTFCSFSFAEGFCLFLGSSYL